MREFTKYELVTMARDLSDTADDDHDWRHLVDCGQDADWLHAARVALEYAERCRDFGRIADEKAQACHHAPDWETLEYFGRVRHPDARHELLLHVTCSECGRTGRATMLNPEVQW